MFTILKPGTGSDGSDSGEVSNVPDSKLVTKFIPAYEGNYTKDRKAQGGTISEITIHHCASILTIDALGALWQREGRKGLPTTVFLKPASASMSTRMMWPGRTVTGRQTAAQ